jgi:hypothetical protein
VEVPVEITFPGVLVIDHPVEGKLFKTILPVATAHVGCVIVPIAGAVGVAGCSSIITSSEGRETQPAALVTLKL